jgi:hypothetical protein
MKKKTRKIWRIIFVILLVATIVDWSIPDPLILIDEIILTASTVGAFLASKKW